MRGLRTTADRRQLLVRAVGSDERGASLALVALSLVWIVGLASLVVDIGAGWLSRQTLIPATDAAALAGAQDLVDRPWDIPGACATAATYVVANAAVASMTDCDVTPLGAGGRITVTASDDLETTFTDLGAEGVAVQSTSTATWGPPLTVSGLRPFGLCYDGSLPLRQLIDNPPTGPTWVRVDFIKDDPLACGGSSSVGNFVTIDFEGGSGTHEIRSWMLDGYPERIAFDPATIADCAGGAICYERPYASNHIMWELQTLRANKSYVTLPVFNYADADDVHLIGLVRARFYDFDFGGPPSGWWLELKVEPGLITGTCCGQPDVLSGNKVIAICGVDPGAYGACGAGGGS